MLGMLSLEMPTMATYIIQDYVLAAEQDANEANIETAKCAKEAAIAKEEARTVIMSAEKACFLSIWATPATSI